MGDKPIRNQQEDNPTSSMAESSHNSEVDFSEMEAQLAEMEEEQKALERLHREIEEKMGKPAPSNGFPPQLTPRERAEVDARSVYVGNVDYSVTAAELEAHFRDCGALNRVTIQVDKFTGHPKGFAFVEFQDRQSVTNALMLTDSLLKGRQIKVTEKRTNRPGISTTNRFPRGGFAGRGRGVIVKYVFPGRGAGFKGRGRYSKHHNQ